MRHNSLISLFLCLLLLTLAGCEYNRSVRQLPHLGNTPYQQDTILVAYATNPERALTLLDSALLLGNVSEYRAQFIRAKIYSKSLAEQRLDSAIAICKDLLKHDSVLSQPAEQMNILDMLIACSRARPDYEQYLQWAQTVLIPDSVFYEFKPKEASNYDTLLTLDQLEIGRSYEMVVSTLAGLYRYKTYKNVLVVGRYHDTPTVIIDRG